MKRVTDLEKFALEEIWWPYQNLMGHDERRLSSLPMGLVDTAKLLATDQTGWAKLVLDRLCNIGICFPSYVRHPLVEVVEDAQHERKQGEPKP